MDQVLEISQLTRPDLVIVITIWRYFRDNLEAARAARAIGATCIGCLHRPEVVLVLGQLLLLVDDPGGDTGRICREAADGGLFEARSIPYE